MPNLNFNLGSVTERGKEMCVCVGGRHGITMAHAAIPDDTTSSLMERPGTSIKKRRFLVRRGLSNQSVTL